MYENCDNIDACKTRRAMSESSRHAGSSSTLSAAAAATTPPAESDPTSGSPSRPPPSPPATLQHAAAPSSSSGGSGGGSVRVFDITHQSPTGSSGPPSMTSSMTSLTASWGSMTSEGMHCYGNERATLTQMGRFYNNKQLSDVRLRVADKVYKAHKMILIRGSDVLEHLLCSSDWKEASKQVRCAPTRRRGLVNLFASTRYFMSIEDHLGRACNANTVRESCAWAITLLSKRVCKQLARSC